MKLQKITENKRDKNCPTYMIKLKNDYIACSFVGGLIIIYNKIFKIILTIKENDVPLNYLFKMKDNKLIACSSQLVILKLSDDLKSYKVLQRFKENIENQYNYLYKAIQLSTSHIISISFDGTMKSYMKENENEDQFFLFKINKKVSNGGTITNIFEIKEKKQFIVIPGTRYNSHKPKLFDSQSCDYIKELDLIFITYYYTNDIYLYLGNGYLIFGAFSYIHIFNLDQQKKISSHPYQYEISSAYSYLMAISRFKKEFIISVNDCGDIEIWKLNKDYTLVSISYFKSIHKDMIYSIVILKGNKFEDDSIITCGKDCKIIINKILTDN